MTPEILTLTGMAERYKISPKTLYNHWRALGGFKITGRIRFDAKVTHDRILEATRKQEEMVLSISKERDHLPGRGVSDQARGIRRRSRGTEVVKRPPSAFGLW